MANPIILIALAAAILSLAALSATAATPNHHELAPTPQPVSKLHHAPPPSAPSKKKAHKHKRHRHKRHSHHATAPSLAVRRGLAPPPEPYPGYTEPADKCLMKLNKMCAREIFGGLFGVGKVDDISDKCCMDLVAMGRSCHRGVLAATLALPWLEKREKRLIKKKNAEVWSRCALVVGALKFAESPFSYNSVD